MTTKTIKNVSLPGKVVIFIIIGLLALLWPLSVITPFSLSASISSSTPIFLGWLYILIIAFVFGVPRQNIAYIQLCLSLIAVISPLIIFAETDVLRSVKTFASSAMFFLLMYMIFYSRKVHPDIFLKVSHYLFNTALIVSLFGLFEMVVRYYVPFLGNFWYQLLETRSFAGITYLQYGYMDYGLFFTGQRPLGLYGDMHTAPLIAVMCAVYFSSIGSQWRFVLSVVAIILTFRWTYYLTIPFLIYLNSGFSRNPSIVVLVLLISIFPAFQIVEYISNDASGGVILEHLGSVVNVGSTSITQIFFGSGYTGSLETKIGYSEIFFYKYIDFFGIAGLIYFLFIVFLMPILSYKKLKMTALAHIKNKRAYLFIMAIPVIGTIHYNSFFTTATAFLYALLVFMPYMQKTPCLDR